MTNEQTRRLSNELVGLSIKWSEGRATEADNKRIDELQNQLGIESGKLISTEQAMRLFNALKRIVKAQDSTAIDVSEGDWIEARQAIASVELSAQQIWLKAGLPRPRTNP